MVSSWQLDLDFQLIPFEVLEDVQLKDNDIVKETFTLLLNERKFYQILFALSSMIRIAEVLVCMI